MELRVSACPSVSACLYVSLRISGVSLCVPACLWVSLRVSACLCTGEKSSLRPPPTAHLAEKLKPRVTCPLLYEMLAHQHIGLMICCTGYNFLQKSLETSLRMMLSPCSETQPAFPPACCSLHFYFVY
ncbi:uncharacterized [Tachysurus ichikawai]